MDELLRKFFAPDEFGFFQRIKQTCKFNDAIFVCASARYCPVVSATSFPVPRTFACHICFLHDKTNPKRTQTDMQNKRVLIMQHNIRADGGRFPESNCSITQEGIDLAMQAVSF